MEDTQNKFLNFRCIDAAITGKVNQDSVTGGSGTQGAEVAVVISQCSVIKGIKGISMCVKICMLEAVFY